MIARFTLALLGWLSLPAFGFCDRLIHDPIADFLRLPAEELYTDASEVVRVYVADVDINGDGKQERFVGHQLMWSGDNHGLYGAFYKSVPDGFVRLTASNRLVVVDPRFFGPRATSFCGFVVERKTQGLLVLQNDFVARNPDDPGLPPARPHEYAYRKLYYIKKDRLMVDELGPLDLQTAEGKSFFNRYFGEGVKSRLLRFQRYPVEKLKERGYTIPDWKHSPPPASQ